MLVGNTTARTLRWYKKCKGQHIFGPEKSLLIRLAVTFCYQSNQRLASVGKDIAWFQTFLKEESKFAMLRVIKSLKSTLDCGIPQKSCLGPLLFIICSKEFDCCLPGVTFNIYAYDTSIANSSTDNTSLQKDIDIEMANDTEWIRQNRLSLNAGKSEFMLIVHMENEINQKMIDRVNKTKYFRLNIGDSLGWKDQYK